MGTRMICTISVNSSQGLALRLDELDKSFCLEIILMHMMWLFYVLYTSVTN